MKIAIPTLWLGRLALHVGLQARLPREQRDEASWLGFAYGSWLPRVRVQRDPKYIPGVSGYWLCFHASADWWPHKVGWGFM